MEDDQVVDRGVGEVRRPAVGGGGRTVSGSGGAVYEVTVPEDPDEAVRRVVVGTVMLEPVLLTLRLLAQRELSVCRAETVDGGRLRTDPRR